MRANQLGLSAILLCLCAPAFALDQSVPRIKGDLSRALLGNGSGVIVGIVDSGVDDTHPGLTGRMVGEANFVSFESDTDDAHGHGTAVAGIILGNDATYKGLAPGAQYLNARVLGSTNTFLSDGEVLNGAGWAAQNGADVLNISAAYFNNPNQSGGSRLSLMADYISGTLHIPVVVAGGNNGNLTGSSPNHQPQGPSDAFNIFSVAASPRTGGFNKVATISSWGGTADGRNAPNLTAPGEAITYSTNWESQPDYVNAAGTSFAAPHVTGMLAQQIQYAKDHNLSHDPLVLKATMLNSAEKINNRLNGAWTPKAASDVNGVYTITSPLDDNAGAGQIDGLALYNQYSAGKQGPGQVSSIGWDINTITGISTLDYDLGQLPGDQRLNATLAWNRHIGINDSGTIGVIDDQDSFFVSESLDNLNLALYRDGQLMAESISTVDNLEHFSLILTDPGSYLLRISRLDVRNSGTDETYGLAWAVAVPEPGAIAVIWGVMLLGLYRMRSTVRVGGRLGNADA